MLSIRKARREDAPAAWAIRNAAILNQCASHYSTDILKVWTDGELSEAFSDIVEQHFHVATYDNHIVGTGMISMETGKIDAVFVHPNHMQKGIGKRIVDFLEDIALKHELKQLTLESTLNAAVFYRMCGFEGDEVTTYVSPRGISMECIPMVKTICAQPALPPKLAASYGIILFVEKYEECVAFYRDAVSLEVAYAKDSLTCFHFGSAYLMVEQDGISSNQEKRRDQNPTVLRFDVADLDAAALELQRKGIPVERQNFDWGRIGVFTDPDGNRCELKSAP